VGRAALIDALVRNALRGVPSDDLERQALHNKLCGWALRVLGSHLSSSSPSLADAGSVVQAIKQQLRSQERDTDAGRCGLPWACCAGKRSGRAACANGGLPKARPAAGGRARRGCRPASSAPVGERRPRARPQSAPSPPNSLDDRYARLAASRAISSRGQQAALALLLQLSRGVGGGAAALNAIATYQPPRLVKAVPPAAARDANAGRAPDQQGRAAGQLQAAAAAARSAGPGCTVRHRGGWDGSRPCLPLRLVCCSPTRPLNGSCWPRCTP
jgi:hypothetical protein